jgi:predicted  nucleic acid-binding Zn-ribbon protein
MITKQEIYKTHLEQALVQIQRIDREKTLLNGHFSKIAKEYRVKSKELKNEYKKAKEAMETFNTAFPELSKSIDMLNHLSIRK